MGKQLVKPGTTLEIELNSANGNAAAEKEGNIPKHNMPKINLLRNIMVRVLFSAQIYTFLTPKNNLPHIIITFSYQVTCYKPPNYQILQLILAIH